MLDKEVIAIIDGDEVEVTNYGGTRNDWETATDIEQNDTGIPDRILLPAIQRQSWALINEISEKIEDSGLSIGSMSDYITDYYTGGIDGLSGWLDNLVVTPKDEYLDYHRDELISDPESMLKYIDVEAYLRDLEMSGSVTVFGDQVVDDAN